MELVIVIYCHDFPYSNFRSDLRVSIVLDRGLKMILKLSKHIQIGAFFLLFMCFGVESYA
jgi:hypothetical protein